jgi:hypothetical protein
MSRYRKVDPRIWNDEKFRELADMGKLVFFMLLTHPNMTALGAMRGTLSGLAEELGWQPEAFREAFADVLAKEMAEHDPKACLIALPNFIKYNQPESPNVIKAWVGALDLLPECALKKAVLLRAKGFADGMTEAYAKAFAEAFSKAMPNQEPEQKQKPKKPPRAPRGGAPLRSLREWLEHVKAADEKAVPDDDPIFEYADSIGLPHEFLRLAWREFVAKHSVPTAGRQKDWRAHFRNSVRGNWAKLWWVDESGYRLTSAGEQAKRAHDERRKAQEPEEAAA